VHRTFRDVLLRLALERLYHRRNLRVCIKSQYFGNNACVNERKPYSTDLTDLQWQHLEPLLPAVRRGGRPARYTRREIVNAVLYVTRNGCAWRNMPHDLPPWSLVYNYFWNYFWRWQRDGVWQAAHEHLVGDLRHKAGRNRLPSAAILDSQSVKTTENRDLKKGGRAASTEPLHPTAASASTDASGT